MDSTVNLLIVKDCVVEFFIIYEMLRGSVAVAGYNSRVHGMQTLTVWAQWMNFTVHHALNISIHTVCTEEALSYLCRMAQTGVGEIGTI